MRSASGVLAVGVGVRRRVRGSVEAERVRHHDDCSPPPRGVDEKRSRNRHVQRFDRSGHRNGDALVARGDIACRGPALAAEQKPTAGP